MTGTATDPAAAVPATPGPTTPDEIVEDPATVAADTGASAAAAPPALGWEVRERPDRLPDAERRAVLADPGFGRFFTDHMATASFTPERGWHAGVIGAYGPLSISPATSVLHYAQSIFEGLKAYRHEDGSVWLFRPEANAARFASSAYRLALPQLPTADFLSSLDALVSLDEAWVPEGGSASLYLRPLMFGSEAFLGVRPSRHVTYCLLASPAGSYFTRGPVPVRIWVSRDFTRAAPGGMGAAKTGGNYAASLLPQQEAYAHGCDQVVFLDATKREDVEELGGMNLWFVFADGTVRTPPTGGTILAGITRDAIVTLLAEAGHEVQEAPYRLADWRADAASGRLVEVFACGTAAVVTSVGTLVDARPDGSIEEVTTGGRGAGEPAVDGEVTAWLRTRLLDLQYGRRPDTHGWLRRVR